MLLEGDPGRLIGLILVLVFPILLAVAAAGDLIRFRIGNRLNLVLALAYLPAAIWIGSDAVTILWHLGAGATVLLAGIVLFSFGLIGGGDVKLLAAAACWVGFAALPVFLVAVALAGGVLALLLLILRYALSGRIAESSPVARLLGRSRDVPYGLAIALGGFFVLPGLDLVHGILAG